MNEFNELMKKKDDEEHESALQKGKKTTNLCSTKTGPTPPETWWEDKETKG